MKEAKYELQTKLLRDAETKRDFGCVDSKQIFIIVINSSQHMVKERREEYFPPEFLLILSIVIG